MNNVYFTIFLIAVPIMTLFSYSATILWWVVGNKRREAKQFLSVCLAGAVSGYIVALIYFCIARELSILELFRISTIGLMVGGGYSVLFYSLINELQKRKLKNNQKSQA